MLLYYKLSAVTADQCAIGITDALNNKSADIIFKLIDYKIHAVVILLFLLGGHNFGKYIFNDNRPASFS